MSVKLKRTFNQDIGNGTFMRFWRVVSESHPNYGSDLSLEGLKEWEII